MNKKMTDFKFTEDAMGIYNSDGNLIAMLVESTSRDEKKIIEHSGEMYTKIQEFVDQVNSKGVFKPRAMVKSFEELLKKIDINE